GGTALHDDSGRVIGQQIVFPSTAGHFFQVRVLPNAPGETRYTLGLQALTADLGTQVHGVQSGSLTAGDEAVYGLSTGASGSLEVTLTPGNNSAGNFRLELLDPDTLSALVSGQPAGTSRQASLGVSKGQGVLLHVFGDAGTQGDFSVEFTNLDQFSNTD